MEWILQTLMMMGAKAASIFINRDSPNFEVVQGMMAILSLVACVLLITVAFRKK
jgi:type III secretory pathway component EscT